MQDIDKIKRNVSKMIDAKAPETDIDAYLSEEGVSAEQLRGDYIDRSGSKFDAVIRGVADAASFGLSDEFGAAFNSAIPIEKLWRPETASMWDTSFEDAYQKNLDIQRGIDKADEQQNFGYRLAGQLPGAIATGAMTGGASIGLRGAGIAAAEGAAYGFGSGEDGLENRAIGAGIGTVGGLTGYGLSRGVSRVLNPQTGKAAKELIEEGVDLTPGQIMGGLGKSVEDRLTSVPVLGDAINAARQRGVNSFNNAAVNRALKHIGKKLPDGMEAGYEAIQYADDAISKAYNDLLPNLKVKLDKTFAQEFKNLRSLASEMPPERIKQFNKIINREIGNRFSKAGQMSGEAMKQAESELGRLIRQYGGSAVGDERLLADALKEAQSQLRGLVMRSNPSKALELKSINKAFANLLRPQSAASKASEGVFSPAQLQTATRILDKSGRKKASSKGAALMQDLATNARNVLPSKIGDSGTAGRLLLPLAAGGSAYGVQSDNPTLQTLGVLGLLGAGAYTRPGQKAIQALLTERPDMAKNLGLLVGATPMGLTGGVLATNP